MDDKDEDSEEFVYLANEDFYELPREAEWKGYLPSNHVNLIDFQDTNNPKVQRMKNMNYSERVVILQYYLQEMFLFMVV